MVTPVRLLVPLSLLLIGCFSQKVQETRTALHVARSLNPDAMEEMQVKTRTGETATLLVKKRDGRQHLPFVKHDDVSLVNQDNSSNNHRPIVENMHKIPGPIVVSSEPVNTKEETETKPKNSDNNKPNIPAVPEPVVVKSEPLSTKDEVDIRKVNLTPKDTARESKTNIHQIPDPVYIRSSPVLVKGQQTNNWQDRARSLMTVDSDGIPVIEGVRMPDDESDKVVWRNARVIDGKLTPYDKSQSKHNFDHKPNTEKKKISSYLPTQWVRVEPVKQTHLKNHPIAYKTPWSTPVHPPPVQEKFKPSELIAVVTTPSTQEWYEFHHPQKTVQIVEEPTSYLPESEMYIRDKILDYIKRVNKEETIKRQQYSDRESRTAKDSIQHKIEARVLHNPGASVYPTSLLYSPPSQQPSRVSFEEGVRTPVLQYAHPELGVQPAKVVTNPEPEVTDKVKLSDRREQAIAYFSHDIHADRSPYAFEPGLEDEARVEDFSNNGKRSHSGISQRPKKTLPYFYADQAVTDSYKDKYYGKFSSNHPSYSAYQSTVDPRPFWQRMSDTFKEHVQTSMDKVSDLTRPVMEPLVEATHKISKNLGLETSGYRDFNTLKEKLGMAGSPSVILPALGLVAGGAALGLGAVAVGRYLDVDMLKRSKDSDVAVDDDLSAEHKRAMESIARSLAEDPHLAQPVEVAGGATPTEAKEALEVVKAVEQAELAQSKNEEAARRRRRSTDPDEAMEAMLQSLDDHRLSEGTMPSPTVWSTTPCAKKVFCEVMSLQSDDSVLFTEKKMATYLNMIHPSMSNSVSFHLDDVMRAIRSKDCSAFICPSVSTREIADYPGPR